MSGPGTVGAVRALRYQELRQQAVSHNLANLSTPGFKAERVFARLLDGAAPEAVSGTDFRQGAAAPTGRPLDLALTGPDFLVVQTPQGERLTRGGALSVDSSGLLVTSAGHPVLGDGGPIAVGSGSVAVDNGGVISVDGERVGRLRVEGPTDGATLARDADGTWRAEGGTEAADDGGTRVLQGHLEDSNVNPTAALVEMIEIQKAYGAIQRTVQTNDEVSRSIATQIGRAG